MTLGVTKKTRASRGTKGPQPTKQDARARALAILSAAEPDAPVARLIGHPSQEAQALQSIAVTPERVQNLTSLVLGMTELSMNHVLHALTQTPTGERLPIGTKDTVTVAAILVDKFAVLQGLVMQLDGRTTGANLAELNRQAAQIVAVTKELERRSQPVDVTPAPASPRGA